MLEPTTLITKGPKAAISKVRERRVDIAKTHSASKALDVVGETLTATAGYGALTLGAAYPAAAGRAALAILPKSPKAILGTITAAGVLTTSHTAREYASKVLQDPTKLGREAGLLIDKAKAGEDVGGISNALKTAGLIGAGVVSGAGLIAAGKAAKGYITNKFFGGTADKAADAMPTSVLSYSSGAIPTAFTPSSNEPVVASPAAEKSPTTEPPPVNVKVINKPQINVAVAQSL